MTMKTSKYCTIFFVNLPKTVDLNVQTKQTNNNFLILNFSDKQFKAKQKNDNVIINTIILYSHPVLQRQLYIDFPQLLEFPIFKDFCILIEGKEKEFEFNMSLMSMLQQLNNYQFENKISQNSMKFKITQDNRFALTALKIAVDYGFTQQETTNYSAPIQKPLSDPSKSLKKYKPLYNLDTNTTFLVYNIPPIISEQQLTEYSKGSNFVVKTDIYLGLIVVLSNIIETQVIEFMNEISANSSSNLKIQYSPIDKSNSDIDYSIAKARLEPETPTEYTFTHILPINMSFYSIANLCNPYNIERISCKLRFPINDYFREYIFYFNNIDECDACQQIIYKLYPN